MFIYELEFVGVISQNMTIGPFGVPTLPSLDQPKQNRADKGTNQIKVALNLMSNRNGHPVLKTSTNTVALEQPESRRPFPPAPWAPLQLRPT